MGKSYDYAKSEIYNAEDNVTQNIAEYFGLDYENVRPSTRKISPEAYEAYLRGLFYFKKELRDDNRLAIESFSEARQKDPTFDAAIGYLAEAQKLEVENGWDQSKLLLAEAEKNCQQALQLNPNNARVMAVLGDIEDIRGNRSKAIVFYEKALAIDQNNILALTNLAYQYLFNLNELSKAIGLLKKLQEIVPTSWRINSNLGIGYAQLKNYSEAIKAFRRALQLNPNDAKSWTNLGITYERIVNYDSAISCYIIAQQKDQLNPDTYFNLVTLLLATKKFSAAESILVVGAKYLPSDHEMIYILGLTYTLAGKRADANESYQEGLRLLERKIRKEPERSHYRADEALYHARLGNSANAIAASSEAFKLDSTDNEILIKIARTYAILANKTKLLEWFERAREKNVEYDVEYITTAIDFEKYRNDRDLVLIARQE